MDLHLLSGGIRISGTGASSVYHGDFGYCLQAGVFNLSPGPCPDAGSGSKRACNGIGLTVSAPAGKRESGGRGAERTFIFLSATCVGLCSGCGTHYNRTGHHVPKRLTVTWTRFRFGPNMSQSQPLSEKSVTGTHEKKKLSLFLNESKNVCEAVHLVFISLPKG